MTITNTNLFEKFQDFVAGMPADQEIENFNACGMGSWDNCAIGLFAKSIGYDGCLSTFAEEVCDGKPYELFSKLNRGEFVTYGELSNYIAWL